MTSTISWRRPGPTRVAGAARAGCNAIRSAPRTIHPRLPVGHACGRTVGNEYLQVVGALGDRQIRGQRFYQWRLCAALKVNFARSSNSTSDMGGALGVGALHHRGGSQRGRTSLVVQLQPQKHPFALVQTHQAQKSPEATTAATLVGRKYFMR